MEVKLGAVWGETSGYPVTIETKDISGIYSCGALELKYGINDDGNFVSHVRRTPGIGIHFSKGTTVGIPGHQLPPTIEEFAVLIAHTEGEEHLKKIPVNIRHSKGPQKYLSDFLPK